jgi:hypothetical protein
MTECVIANRPTNRKGYAIATWEQTKATGQQLAHRAAYVLSRGPIPKDMTLDHLCETKNCIEPTHLEPVTRGENTSRWMRKHAPRCPHGGATKGSCNQCMAGYARAYRERMRRKP